MLTEQFKHAAIVRGFGHEDEDHALQRAGLRAIRRTAQEFDAIGPEARLVGLVPLLDDPDPNIRVMAAACLALVMPERAIPVLEHIDKYDPTRASMQTMHLLSPYREGKLRWINGLD